MSYYSKNAIAQIANAVYDSLHKFDPATFNNKPPIDIKKAIEAFGGAIVNNGSVWNFFSKIGQVSPLDEGDNYRSRKFEVTIPADEYGPRANFTMAHELGHVILHYKWADPEAWVKNCNEKLAMYRDLSPNKIEYEANYFAAFFLMPEEWLRKDVEQTYILGKTNLINHLAEKYRVSYSSMEIRLSQIGVL